MVIDDKARLFALRTLNADNSVMGPSRLCREQCYMDICGGNGMQGLWPVSFEYDLDLRLQSMLCLCGLLSCL